VDHLLEIIKFLSEEGSQNAEMEKMVQFMRIVWENIKTLYAYWRFLLLWNIVLTGLMVWQYLKIRGLRKRMERFSAGIDQKEVISA